MCVHHRVCNVRTPLASRALSYGYDLHGISFERRCLRRRACLCASMRTHGQRVWRFRFCLDSSMLDIMAALTIGAALLSAMRVFDTHCLFPLPTCGHDHRAYGKSYLCATVAHCTQVQRIWCYVGTLAYLNDHALTSFLKPSLRCMLPPTTTLCILMTSFKRHLGSCFKALYTGALENLPMTS